MIDFDIFTEQAEYISRASFEKWSIKHHDEATVIKKLTQGGAKLITGPRGCGKTTLMLKANNSLIKHKGASALPVYVNFKSSLKLEPLYRSNANAAFWFNQWLLLKVLQGLCQSVESIGGDGSGLGISGREISRRVNLLEMGRIDAASDSSDSLTVGSIEDYIGRALEQCGRSRCVLLLDDAGHAFSSEQQHDFFEFFREIKTKEISPKAAIYPGVTSYSSSFHVGHDAEEIDVWVRPSSVGYLEFMHSILRSRFRGEVYDQLAANESLLDLLCYAAYGIPRSLLNMISMFYRDEEGGSADGKIIALDYKKTLRAIKVNFDNTYQIYDSLKIKLPMYEKFVDAGTSFFEKCLTLNKDFNRGSGVSRQSSMIGIKRPISHELSRVIGFFQYAGLISKQGISSRGGKGVYEIFELHYSAIVERNVFFSSRAINVDDYCAAFSSRPNHHYPRHTEQSVLDVEKASEVFTLALPPCEVCKTPRVSGEAKFCANCGAKLKDASVFENIVSQDVSSLPITENRAESIKAHSRIRTIKDVLMDHENAELRSVHMIGPVWAQRIRSYAEEFIA
jgi:energy-coupling factor transporter ATP-binding protein EcfA2